MRSFSTFRATVFCVIRLCTVELVLTDVDLAHLDAGDRRGDRDAAAHGAGADDGDDLCV